jgi:ribosome-binding factor A
MNRHRQRGARAPQVAHEVCVDPDQYFSDTAHESPAHRRKAEQLRIAIRRALAGAVDCDIRDPLLEGMQLLDVFAEPGGAFAAVFAAGRGADVDVVQRRLREAAPIFKGALARALTRKRVPQLGLHVVPLATTEVTDD